MEASAKRRLALFGSGLVLAMTLTTLLQMALVDQGVVDAEPYAVTLGLGTAMPLLLASAYPLTERNADSRRARILLASVETTAGVLVGVVAVTLLVALELPNLLPVGGGAAATYLGAVAGRAVVLGRLATGPVSRADESN